MQIAVGYSRAMNGIDTPPVRPKSTSRPDRRPLPCGSRAAAPLPAGCFTTAGVLAAQTTSTTGARPGQTYGRMNETDFPLAIPAGLANRRIFDLEGGEFHFFALPLGFHCHLAFGRVPVLSGHLSFHAFLHVRASASSRAGIRISGYGDHGQSSNSGRDRQFQQSIESRVHNHVPLLGMGARLGETACRMRFKSNIFWGAHRPIRNRRTGT
ncbi:MAG: hypothetical protein HYY36_00315 [Gammaproteobacteria bacterium]|nr:hypothetical protein [Gammaproteobacteria bacterium]